MAAAAAAAAAALATYRSHRLAVFAIGRPRISSRFSVCLSFFSCQVSAASAAEMGATMGKPLADCATSALSCAAGEPQEMCSYGGGAPGHRPGQPCDWGNLSSLCTSQLASCECSAPTGVEGSALARYTERPLDAAFVYAGPVMLWTLTLAVWRPYTPDPNPNPNPNPNPLTLALTPKP